MKNRKLINISKWIVLAMLIAVLSFVCVACDVASSKDSVPPDGSSYEPSGNDTSGSESSDNKPSENLPPEIRPSANEPSLDEPYFVIPSDGVVNGRYEDAVWAENFTLPSADGALEKLNTIYGGAEKVFLLQNGRIARMPCPQGETITLNMTYKVGPYTRMILEDSIAEFNEVFSVINPNYKFAINYSPTDADFAKKYSVRMSVSDKLAVTETSQVFGLAHVEYYDNFTSLGNFGITIKTEVLNNGSYFMTTFKHELMHLLGAGDAYKNAKATKATVMQSYTVSGYHFLSETDLMFLDTLYRNPELDSYDDGILDFIDNYEETTAHTKQNLTAAVYKKLADSLNPTAVINQATEIGYKDLTEFSATVKDGIVRNAEFGKMSISFKEIEYAETPSETYFGSIDPKAGTYWHGRQTTLGSSQGIRYIDYGSGLIYASPNGNLYTIMMQTCDFVLAFRLSGSFTNLSAMSLDLWHISK
ncbi:MAG: hypothetical protein K2J16_05680 [Clostridia bacterium]|nr:hypothetical protein [Clostridia bacterium]